MKRIFVTHILPEDLIARYKLSFAACNFSNNLISGGGFDLVYSTMPTYVQGRLELDKTKNRGIEYVYSSLRTQKGNIAKVATFIEQWILFRKIPSNSSVWLYNISTLNVLLYILIRFFKRSVQINIIVLDFTPPINRFSKSSFFLWIINNAHGIIKLANSELFTNPNSCCLAGVTPVKNENPKISKRKSIYLLSGVLQPDISSIPIILDAFAQKPDSKLYITGVFSDMDLLSKYTEGYSNIKYLGVLNFSEYIELLHSVSFQLSLRNPLWADNTCNFPSKIIEALLHNRGVISTILYEQIEGIKYIKTDRSIEGFVKTLTDIENMSDFEWFQYVNQGKIVSDMLSATIWNNKMEKIESK